MPVLLWQIWRFVTPGLYDHEKRYAMPFVVCAWSLFVLGAMLAYCTLPEALEFLVSIGGDDIESASQASKYFQLITYMMLAFGIGFEFPIVLDLPAAGRHGRRRHAAAGRRYAIVIICVIVAVDHAARRPDQHAALAVPMCMFYEVAILIGAS